MAVNITKATLGDTGPLYIRDVLRNSLTDTQSTARSGNAWIFLSHLRQERLVGNLPRVYVNQTVGSKKRQTLDPDNPKTGAPILEVTMVVWASGGGTEDGDSIRNRDTIADEIVSILSTTSSTDGTKTIRTQGLRYMNSDMRTNDRMMSLPNRRGSVIIRMKNIDVRFKYIGSA